MPFKCNYYLLHIYTCIDFNDNLNSQPKAFTVTEFMMEWSHIQFNYQVQLLLPKKHTNSNLYPNNHTQKSIQQQINTYIKSNNTYIHIHTIHPPQISTNIDTCNI